MSEENSLLGDALVGLNADTSPVESAPQEPAFGDIVDANRKAEDDALAKLLQAKGVDESPAQQSVSETPEEAEPEVSEEPSEEPTEETLSDESTDEDDSVLEESDDADEFVDDDADVSLFDPDSLKDGALKCNGETRRRP